MKKSANRKRKYKKYRRKKIYGKGRFSVLNNFIKRGLNNFFKKKNF